MLRDETATVTVRGAPVQIPGARRKGASALVVSNGVGNGFPLRTAAPAEIVHLTLHRTV